jgi:hypothetical protein
MYLLDPTYIMDNVDYSFGDQASDVHKLFNGYIKDANINNVEFIEKYNQIKLNKNIMTLFIDNIRLYQRKGIKYTSIELSNESNRLYKDTRVEELKHNDLLKLCSELSDMNFIIFTNFEDTPIDEEIHNKIPDNVLGIYAGNAQSFGNKVIPMPYGLQRKLYPNDNRHEILTNLIDLIIKPNKLLYINHNVNTNILRQKINNLFENKNWVTLDTPTHDYTQYLLNIKNHKFMICPEGNAIGCDCHRNWEVIYMRRVPIIEKNEYLEKIFHEIPVLFVDSFFDITEEFLNKNNYLYEEMQSFDLTKLDIELRYKDIIKKHNL